MRERKREKEPADLSAQRKPETAPFHVQTMRQLFHFPGHALARYT
jgi:hypothetical protein